MVYRNLTLVQIGDFQDKIRGIIEKSCTVFKMSMCHNGVAGLENVKRFFQTTHDYLRSKVGEAYAANKLGREIDLEWQSMMTEIGLKSEEVDQVNKMLSHLGIAEENENMATFENTAGKNSLQASNLFSVLNEDMLRSDLNQNPREQDPLELTVKHQSTATSASSNQISSNAFSKTLFGS